MKCTLWISPLWGVSQNGHVHGLLGCGTGEGTVLVCDNMRVGGKAAELLVHAVIVDLKEGPEPRPDSEISNRIHTAADPVVVVGGVCCQLALENLHESLHALFGTLQGIRLGLGAILWRSDRREGRIMKKVLDICGVVYLNC